MGEKEKGKFLKVNCERCGNEQIIFGKSSTRVKCLSCNKLLVRVGGGKTKVKSMVREVL